MYERVSPQGLPTFFLASSCGLQTLENTLAYVQPVYKRFSYNYEFTLVSDHGCFLIRTTFAECVLTDKACG